MLVVTRASLRFVAVSTLVRKIKNIIIYRIYQGDAYPLIIPTRIHGSCWKTRRENIRIIFTSCGFRAKALWVGRVRMAGLSLGESSLSNNRERGDIWVVTRDA